MDVTADAALLGVRGLRKAFGSAVVLDDLDLDLAAGTVTVVSGANGAGKSTLLECLAGAQPPDAGTLHLHGEPTSTQTTEHWRHVHAILDDFAWFPDLSVLDHLRLLDPSLDRDAATAALARLGADAHVDRLPATLSSGQRQRCALASALVRPWSVLVVDEPERHLDAEAVPAVAALLASLADDGRAVLVASHDPAFTRLSSARRLVVSAGRLEPAG